MEGAGCIGGASMRRLKLFDTKSRDIRVLKEGDSGEFGFYCCGPTVYGPAHIGNFRTFVLQDLFRRVLELSGMKTRHVRNLTDVDDKTIRGAQAEGRTLEDFTDRWVKRFHADCEALGMLAPDVEPSAVEHIPQQIRMIEALVNKGHAYAASDGSVYFRISSFGDYGKLSRLDSRELELGKTQNLRSSADEYEKDSIADFVLWKARRDEDGENFWESPWGEGRPGWHLECSAMIQEYLGDSFELHSGGVDLIFPHHENEIAQSKCACGGSFAGHWFHIAHLMVEGSKMSKSLGNMYTLDGLEERGFTAMEVRYVLLSGHYRKQFNFTLEALVAARSHLQRIARVVAQLCEVSGGSLIDFSELVTKQTCEGEWGEFIDVWEKLCDDLNSPAALGKFFSSFGAIEKRLNAGEISAAGSESLLRSLSLVLAVFGLKLPAVDRDSEVVALPKEIQELAERRWQAKLNKDWGVADALREELLGLGWVVKDSKNTYDLRPADE